MRSAVAAGWTERQTDPPAHTDADDHNTTIIIILQDSSQEAATLTFTRLSNDTDNVGMLQLHHDATLLLKLLGKLLVHHLFQSFDRHVLYSTVLVRVSALQHFAVVTLNAPRHSCSRLNWPIIQKRRHGMMGRIVYQVQGLIPGHYDVMQ